MLLKSYHASRTTTAIPLKYVLIQKQYNQCHYRHIITSSSHFLSRIVGNKNHKSTIISTNNNVDNTKSHDNKSIEGLFSRNSNTILTKQQPLFPITLIKHHYSTTTTSNNKQEHLFIKPKKEIKYLPSRINSSDDIKSYALTIKELSNMKSDVGAKLAIQTLRVMYNMGIKPNEYIYSLVINAQANSKDMNAGKVSEELLTEMYNLYRTGSNKKIKPNIVIYNNVMNAHIQSSSSSLSNDNFDNNNNNSYEHVLKLLNEIYAMKDKNGFIDLQPDVITYNLVLKSLSKLPINNTSSSTSSSTTSTWIELEVEKHIQKMKNDNIKFDIITYNTLLYIYLNKTSNTTITKAMNIFTQEIYNNSKIKPNNKTYHHIINKLSKIGDIKNIEYILQIINMQYKNTNSTNRKNNNDIQLDTKLYNMILHAYVGCNNNNNGGGGGGGDKAEAMLHEMNFLHNAGMNKSCKPDVVSYNTIINAYSKQILLHSLRNDKDKILYKMDLLLKEMYNQYDISNDESILPNVITHNSIINVYAQSIINTNNSNDNSNIKIILRLEDMLQEMKESYKR